MKCIEAIIKPSMLEDVKQRVRQVGVKLMTLSEVTDCGGTIGQQRIYRTTYIVDSVSRVRLQTIVDETMVGPVVDAIMASACSGEADNGTISIYPVAETIRIEPGARPYQAISEFHHEQARVA
jgi:nitrogen regulatory protein P-II 1